MSDSRSRGSERVVDFHAVQYPIIKANLAMSKVVQQASGFHGSDLRRSDIERIHKALLPVLQETVRAIDQAERSMRVDYDSPRSTPKEIISEHGDRIEEHYDGAVLNLALMLLESNRREWLHQKPETNGANEVERHGLTANQRSWLNELQSEIDALSDTGSEQEADQ